LKKINDISQLTTW